MKPLYLIRTLIILFSLSASGSLFAGMNPDGTITFESGQIQYASSFAWGESLPRLTVFGFVTDPNLSSSTMVVSSKTINYTASMVSAFVNSFTQNIQPICGGTTQAVVSGNSVTYTLDPTSCYMLNSSSDNSRLTIVRVTTPGGWANCRSTAISPPIERKVTSSADGIIYRHIDMIDTLKTYDVNGVVTSATSNEVTISSGSSSTPTTYQRVSSYESIIDITQMIQGVYHNDANALMISCAGTRYSITRTQVTSENGYIRFMSGLTTDHLNVISSTLPNYTPQQVNNRVISPALDVIPSPTINVGSIAGFTYPEWHEYPFQITAVSDVEINVGASIDFPVQVRWTCTPPTGNVNFEIRSPSGTNLCNGQGTSHPAVTTLLDVRAAWRPSSASATGAWSATATVEYTLP